MICAAAHGARESHQFVHSFAFGAQRNEKTNDLLLGQMAFEQLVHDLFRLLSGEITSGFNFVQ